MDYKMYLWYTIKQKVFDSKDLTPILQIVGCKIDVVTRSG